MQVVTLLWLSVRGDEMLFASPDANAEGGMLYDPERSPSAARLDRWSGFCDLSDYMDDFQRQKEMTASALRKQAVILFDLTLEER